MNSNVRIKLINTLYCRQGCYLLTVFVIMGSFPPSAPLYNCNSSRVWPNSFIKWIQVSVGSSSQLCGGQVLFLAYWTLSTNFFFRQTTKPVTKWWRLLLQNIWAIMANMKLSKKSYDMEIFWIQSKRNYQNLSSQYYPARKLN